MKQHLKCIKDEIDDNINVVNLGPRYIKSCVSEFKRGHSAFVYGKKGFGHYLNQKGESVYQKTMRIGKLNPKYTEMIKQIIKTEQDKEDLDMF